MEEAIMVNPKQNASKDPLAGFRYFHYIHDRTTGLFHVPGCPRCTKDTEQMQGFGTLKGCIKKELRPCSCCKKETNQYLREKGTVPKGYLYSIRSSRKIMHFPDCSIIRQVLPSNIRSFGTIGEAWSHGYCICQKCNPLKTMYQVEEEKIRNLCLSYPMTVALKSDGIHVISQYDFWRIIIEEYRGNPVLYHRNTMGFRRADHSCIPMYHKQKSSSSTLVGHLRYIIKHDTYRNQTENTSEQNNMQNAGRSPSNQGQKGQRLKQRSKSRKRQQNIAHVLSLIEELAACNR